MGVLANIFKARDKPENRTAGSAYTFYMGGTTSGKAVAFAECKVGFSVPIPTRANDRKPQSFLWIYQG